MMGCFATLCNTSMGRNGMFKRIKPKQRKILCVSGRERIRPCVPVTEEDRIKCLGNSGEDGK